MSQTLQQQLLSAKSMNGIISFDDGAGTTISNGQVITNGVNTDSITTNGLNATNMTLENLTVTTSANVPDVPIDDAYSTNAANTNYVNDYVTSKIKQDEYNIYSISAPTSYVEGSPVNWSIDSNSVTTITIADESIYAAVGYRYNIFPSKEWTDLASSITVNTESGSSFIYNNLEVTSFTMSANNPSISMICISVAGSGNICWIVTDRDPNTILSSDNTFTGTNTFQGQTVLTDTICLTGNMDLPSNTSLITTTSLGLNALSACPATAYAENITAIGSSAMRLNTSAGTANTAIGAEAFGQATNLGTGNVAIGYRAGYTGITTQAISNCTFIGNNTGIGTINSISNSIAIGNGAIVTASNNIVLGGTGLLVIIPSNMQKGTSFIERASGTIISANYTLPTTLFVYYSINSISSFSITFPAASLSYVSNRMTFKRISGNPANSITSASANIYQMDGTLSNQLLPPNVYSVTLVSMFLTGSPTFTYGWVIVEQDRNASYVDLTTNQDIFGVKTFEDGIVISPTKDFNLQGCLLSANQSYTLNNSTVSLTDGKMIFVGSNVLNLILPTPSPGDVGKIFTIIKSGSAGTTLWELTLQRPGGATYTFNANGFNGNTSYTLNISEFSVDIVITGSSGVCYNVVYNNPNLLRNDVVFTNPFFLPPQSVIPNIRSGINTIVIGQDALITASSGIHLSSNTVIGAAAGKVISGNPSALTIIGKNAFGQSTALSNYCTAVGFQAGYNQTSGASVNSSFFGAETGVASPTTAYTQSTALGYGSIISASNQVVLGTATETVYVPGILQVQNNYVNSASPNLITTTITLSGVLYRFYSVTSASAYSITLPTAAVGYLGCTVTFRRVGGTITNEVTSSSSNIFTINSITPSNRILQASVTQITICCMVITATPTYGWVAIG